MRLPHAPASLLSPSGHLAAVAYGGVLAVVDTRSGERIDLRLPESEGQAIAFSADDKRAAIHAGGRIAITSTDSPEWSEAGSVGAKGTVYRAVLGKNVLVAAIRTGDHTMNLGVWRVDGDALEPLGTSAGLELGASAVHHLHLDEANDRVLLGGVSGRSAFSGDGTPFTGIVELAPDLPLVWKGDGLPFRPHGYLYPLAGGGLAITQRDRIARLDLGGLPHVEEISQSDWDTPLERIALSPDGKTFAWMWTEENGQARLRVATMGDATAVADANFDLVGNFPALAVDNNGVATLVTGKRSDQLVIVRVSADSGAQVSSISVPSEPDV